MRRLWVQQKCRDHVRSRAAADKGTVHAKAGQYNSKATCKLVLVAHASALWTSHFHIQDARDQQIQIKYSSAGKGGKVSNSCISIVAQPHPRCKGRSKSIKVQQRRKGKAVRHEFSKHAKAQFAGMLTRYALSSRTNRTN